MVFFRSRPVTAPDLKRAWFTGAAKDEIALDFGQPMTWRDEMKKDIYLDDAAAPISAGSVSGNVITLKLKSPSSAKTIGYISGRLWDGKAASLIFGANGIAALTFCDVPIAGAADIPPKNATSRAGQAAMKIGRNY